MILDSSGRPIVLMGDNTPDPPKAEWHPTRQLIRAYLRQCGISHINRYYGLEPRKVRRILALALAKNPKFKEQVRQLTNAF